MIFDLVKDFAAVLGAVPETHPRHRLLRLIDEGVRREAAFLDRHPTALFQCLWNAGWWYDSPAAARYTEPPEGGWGPPGPPWEEAGERLSGLLERWRTRKGQHTHGFLWARSLLPPPAGLGSARCVVLNRHHGFVKHIAFAPDGETVASCGQEDTFRVWNARTGELRAAIRPGDEEPRALAFAPDGRRLAVLIGTYLGKALEVWDWPSGNRLASAPASDRAYSHPSFSADGRRLLYTTSEGRTHLWTIGEPEPVSFGDDLEAGLWMAPEASLVYPTAAALAPDGTRIATGYSDGTVTVWDVGSGGPVVAFDTGSAGGVEVISFSPDGRVLYTLDRYGTEADTPRTARLASWVASTGERLGQSEWPEPQLVSLALAADGRTVAVVREGTPEVIVREAGADGPDRSLPGYEQPSTVLAFSPDGRRLASGSFDGTVCVWDLQDRMAAPRARRASGLDGNTVACWSPSGDTLAVGNAGGAVRLWDLLAGGDGRVIPAHGRSIYAIAFSPDGTRLATGSCAEPFWMRMEPPNPADAAEPGSVRFGNIQPAEEPVRVWDVRTGKERARCPGFEMPVHALAFSPDGRRLAAADNTLPRACLFDAPSGRKLAEFATDRPAPVTALAWSPDGRRLALGTVGEDPVLLIDPETGTRHGTWVCPDGVASVAALAFSADGRRLVATLVVHGESDFRLRGWDLASGECLALGTGLTDVRAVAAPERFRFRLVQRPLEAELQVSATGEVAGFVPRSAAYPAAHPDGRTFAVPSVHLHAFRVEAR